MMRSEVGDSDLQERATNSESLKTRLELNKRYQSKDFHGWLHKRLAVASGEQILDVGCGTGAQSLRFLEEIGENGSVSALDISEPSIRTLLESASGDARLQAVIGDMQNLDRVIDGQFRQKRYTLAHSAYAIYYAGSSRDVLRHMASALEPAGRLAVFVPSSPHGMVEIASRFSAVPREVTESLSFGPSVLEPEMRALFWEVEVHYFQSEMRVTSVSDFMSFYAATTYFQESAVPQIRAYAERELVERGSIDSAKNGYLIIGRDRRRSAPSRIER